MRLDARAELYEDVRANAAQNAIAIRKGPAGPRRKLGAHAQIILPDAKAQDATVAVPEQLVTLLAKSWTRVRDLFHEWDASGDGMVDREEFVRAIATLGLQCGAEDAARLYAVFDVDGSGRIDIVR